MHRFLAPSQVSFMLFAWRPASTVAPLLPPRPTMSSPGFRFVLVGFAAAAARPARIAKRRIGAAGSGSIGALRQRPSVAASMRRAGVCACSAQSARLPQGCSASKDSLLADIYVSIALDWRPGAALFSSCARVPKNKTC